VTVSTEAKRDTLDPRAGSCPWEEEDVGQVKRRAVAVLVGGTLALGSVGGALAATARIRAKGERWRPAHTFIGRGDRVTWRNPTSRTHDVKGYGGWSFSKVLPPGASVSRRFRSHGTYKFRCVRHSAIVGGQCRGMCGLIHVS
jgi:plastocyanin